MAWTPTSTRIKKIKSCCKHLLCYKKLYSINEQLSHCSLPRLQLLTFDEVLDCHPDSTKVESGTLQGVFYIPIKILRPSA